MARAKQAFSGSAARAKDPFTTAVRGLTVGKKLPGAVYVHQSLFLGLPAPVRDGIIHAGIVSGVAPIDYELFKLGSLEPTVSFLRYPGFWSEPFPTLRESVTVRLDEGTFRRASYAQGDGTPILHRKETFIDSEDPRVPRLRAVTENLEVRGLFRNTKIIGRQGIWNEMLRAAGVRVEGTRVIDLRDES